MSVKWDAFSEQRYVTGEMPGATIVCGHYLRLIRFQYHASFVSVVFGALYVAKKLTPTLAESLLMLYLSFNMLLYGGLYTINAITDLNSDARHPVKRERPLPSRKINVWSAAVFAALLVLSGLLTGFLLFGPLVCYVYAAFLTVNVFYSLVARSIPYFELLVNAITHPMRFVMGVLLVNGEVPHGLLLAIFFLAFGLVTTRRGIEKNAPGSEARKSLQFYPDRALFALKLLGASAILLILALDASVPKVFYWAALAIYLALVFGIDFCAPVKRVFVKLWTR